MILNTKIPMIGFRPITNLRQLNIVTKGRRDLKPTAEEVVANVIAPTLESIGENVATVVEKVTGKGRHTAGRGVGPSTSGARGISLAQFKRSLFIK